jgi:NAD(P)-dependent dehydrogenase (short-subunit alcohol dehydrogenase family)
VTGPLSDRIALVTGASRGIGNAAALALAKAGAHVVVVARTVGGLEELDDAIRAAGGSATLVPLDVTDYDGIDRLGAALAQRYGRLDILLGNAGILGSLSPLDHVEIDVWEKVFAVNVTANFRLIRATVGLLKNSDAGRAVFLTSTAVWRARAYWGAYASSKAAVETLVRVFAAETATTNVRVNLVNPGRVRTRMLSSAFPAADLSDVPTPEQVAERIVALCLPTMTDTGRYYDLANDRFLEFRPPA